MPHSHRPIRPRFFHTWRSQAIVQCAQHFVLPDNSKGSVIKLQLSNWQITLNQLKTAFQELIGVNKLHLLTMPTHRLTGDYPDLVYAGHNASFITNVSGAITASMSKRQGKECLGVRKRIPDARFPTASTVGVFAPRFTTIDEELAIWHKRATLCASYPLYLHTLPLHGSFSVRAEVYQHNVQYLLEQNEPYTLYSSVSASSDRYIAASNCNTTTEKALFGYRYLTETQDQFCQQAVFKMASKLTNNSADYQRKAQHLKLTQGSEACAISPETYLSMASL